MKIVKNNNEFGHCTFGEYLSAVTFEYRINFQPLHMRNSIKGNNKTILHKQLIKKRHKKTIYWKPMESSQNPSWLHWFGCNNFTYCLFPKRQFLRTHGVGPLGFGWLSFNLVYCLDFHPPTNRDLYLVGGGGEGRIFGSKFDFFLSCLGVV